MIIERRRIGWRRTTDSLPRRVVGPLLMLFGLGVLTATAPAQDVERADDVFATVDGEPVHLAELDLLLRRRFANSPQSRKLIEGVQTDRLRRAAAAMVVRNRLAMRTLRRIGGESLQRQLQQAAAAAEQAMKDRGSSLQQRADATGTTAEALRRAAAWETAWGKYLRTHLTEKNLRRFHQTHRDRYGDVEYEDVLDPPRLRRDATDALFETLVRQSADADVTWHVDELRPPDGVEFR